MCNFQELCLYRNDEERRRSIENNWPSLGKWVVHSGYVWRFGRYHSMAHGWRESGYERLTWKPWLFSDARNYDGRTALHIAVAESKEEIVRYLISQGANPRLEDRLGRTAFSELKPDCDSLTELLEWGETLQISDTTLTEWTSVQTLTEKVIFLAA